MGLKLICGMSGAGKSEDIYNKIKQGELEEKMIKFLIGFFLGANVSLFLYALILCGSRADKRIKREEEKIE